MDFVNVFYYYFKMIIQVLFDNDAQLLEYNSKQNGDSKPVLDKRMRFSMNKEQHESFLADSVRSQLDFYKQLEDMLVPTLFTRNISFVMTLSNRLT